MVQKNGSYSRPKIVISKCLEFDACRYDGQMISNKYIALLKNHVDFITVCPEVEIGMGTPRDPIRIIENKKDNTILYQPSTGMSFGPKMNKFSKSFIKENEFIDGFIFKSKSPSCAIGSSKIYHNKESSIPIGTGSGLFTKEIISHYVNYPMEEETRFNNVFLREHFYTSIFTIADFKLVNDMKDLYSFHSKNKYLFMTYNQVLLKKMGNIAANLEKVTYKEVYKNYFKHLLIMFKRRPRYLSNINTLMHVFGYFKNNLSNKEKSFFLDQLDDYRHKKKPLSSITNILSSWIVKYDNKYLEKQSYFNSFPNELVSFEESRLK